MLMGYINNNQGVFVSDQCYKNLSSDTQNEFIPVYDQTHGYNEERINLMDGKYKQALIELVFSLRLFWPENSEHEKHFEKGYNEELQEKILNLIKLDRDLQFVKWEEMKISKIQKLFNTILP